MRRDRHFNGPAGKLTLVLRRRQRLLGAILAGITVLATLSAIRPAPEQMVAVLVSTTNLGSGHVLTSSDVAIAQLPKSAVAALPLVGEGDAVGRTTVGPVAAGEFITATRLLSPGMLADIDDPSALADGLVAAPVRLADAAQARLLRVGDRVDVLAARATKDEGELATTIAVDVPVLSVPSADNSAEGGLLGGGGNRLARTSESVIVVGVDRSVAVDLAAAATRSQLSVVVKPAG